MMILKLKPVKVECLVFKEMRFNLKAKNRKKTKKRVEVKRVIKKKTQMRMRKKRKGPMEKKKGQMVKKKKEPMQKRKKEILKKKKLTKKKEPMMNCLEKLKMIRIKQIKNKTTKELKTMIWNHNNRMKMNQKLSKSNLKM